MSHKWGQTLRDYRFMSIDVNQISKVTQRTHEIFTSNTGHFNLLDDLSHVFYIQNQSNSQVRHFWSTATTATE